jgi:hypothetical protein
MLHRRSRTARLRTPFVVTVALGAAACGGGVGTGSHDRKGDGTSDADAGLEETRVCPGIPPAEGTLCNYVGSDCVFGTPTACQPLPHAACVDHKWTIQNLASGGCNPPPPMCPERPCPAEPPANGDPCTVSSVCSRTATCVAPGYDAKCLLPGGFPTTCAGTWQVTPSYLACNPPPPSFDAGRVVPVPEAGPVAPLEDAGGDR